MSVIEKTKKAVSIPEVGNGDVRSACDAIEMINKTGCDGIMVGRGSQGNPWIFSEISAALRGEKFEYPDFEARMRVALDQLDDMIAEKGERTGVAEAKKHMAWYVSGVRDSNKARAELMTSTTSEQIKQIIERLIVNVKLEGEI